jgi:hypothetical protein
MILYIEALEGEKATIGAQECDVLDELIGESKKRELWTHGGTTSPVSMARRPQYKILMTISIGAATRAI